MKKVIIPFDYQLKHIDTIIRKLSKCRKVLAQLPTGGGKTVEIALIVDRYLKKNPNKSVLILVHRIELLNQAKATIDLMFPEYGVDLIVAGVKYVNKCHIYIGMVETVDRRAECMPGLDLGLVIVDEAHIGNFTKIHQIFIKEYIIGFTATNIAQSKKTPLKNYYDDIAVGPQISELIKLKRLAQNITRCPKDVVQENELMMDSRTGDFDIRQMGMVFQRPKYVNNCYMAYSRYCRGEKTLIFNVNVEHSLDVTDRLVMSGIPCKHIDGETDPEVRAEIIKWFSETPDAVLCNVGIVNVGFDEPRIKNVIVNVATMSVTKWIQMCGRGGRYIAGEKETFNIIDLGGNSVRFGDWNDDRDWERVFWEPERPGKPGLAPVKVCPECLGLIHAARRQCNLPHPTIPNEICGYFFEPDAFEESKIFDEMKLMTKSIDLNELIAQNARFKPYFTFYELSRICASKVKDRELTPEQAEFMFNQYYERVKDWFKLKFPKKRFNEEWHKNEARKSFFDNVNLYKSLTNKT